MPSGYSIILRYFLRLQRYNTVFRMLHTGPSAASPHVATLPPQDYVEPPSHHAAKLPSMRGRALREQATEAAPIPLHRHHYFAYLSLFFFFRPRRFCHALVANNVHGLVLAVGEKLFQRGAKR